MVFYIENKKVANKQKQKAPLYQSLHDTLHAGVIEYLIERSNQYLRLLIPTLTTGKRDRL